MKSYAIITFLHVSNIHPPLHYSSSSKSHSLYRIFHNFFLYSNIGIIGIAHDDISSKNIVLNRKKKLQLYRVKLQSENFNKITFWLFELGLNSLSDLDTRKLFFRGKMKGKRMNGKWILCCRGNRNEKKEIEGRRKWSSWTFYEEGFVIVIGN